MNATFWDTSKLKTKFIAFVIEPCNRFLKYKIAITKTMKFTASNAPAQTPA